MPERRHAITRRRLDQLDAAMDEDGLVSAEEVAAIFGEPLAPSTTTVELSDQDENALYVQYAEELGIELIELPAEELADLRRRAALADQADREFEAEERAEQRRREEQERREIAEADALWPAVKAHFSLEDAA